MVLIGGGWIVRAAGDEEKEIRKPLSNKFALLRGQARKIGLRGHREGIFYDIV
jgi:hypothetical protein